MVSVDVESSFEPIIGCEVQIKELVNCIMKDSDKKWNIRNDNIRYKLQTTLTKVVNKGSNNMIAIVI